MDWDSFLHSLAGKRVVLSGCGGGSDVLGTSVIYARIKDTAKEVIFFSLSFTRDELLQQSCRRISRKCWLVEPHNVALRDDPEEKVYFPEARMANVTGQPIYTLSHFASIQEYTAAYEAALGYFGRRFFGGHLADVLILCDGGCDVLLTGRETGLATPVEDMAHLRAVQPLDIPKKFISALGANVDCAHGVVQEELDSRLEQMQRSGTMLLSQPIDLDDPAGQYFAELVSRCVPSCSIVQSLVLAAMEGHVGCFLPPQLAKRISKNKVPLTEQTRKEMLVLLSGSCLEEPLKVPGRTMASWNGTSRCKVRSFLLSPRAHRVFVGLPVFREPRGHS
ncbi:unnamed protein product [Durusdinium trenchii]|uniref:DUF1152 domain-containing protein n=1 Tax=Durusdinium trenchii TaxID=1381693 RepID=A0ABP0PY10_9DINO